jgi:hypothetical protein
MDRRWLQHLIKLCGNILKKKNNKIKVIKTSEVEKTYDNIIVKLQE